MTNFPSLCVLIFLLLEFFSLPAGAACNSLPGIRTDKTGKESLSFEVIKKYPHDTGYFTQGLVFENGILYEGTGRYGQSLIVRKSLINGRIMGKINLPGQFFGEGITVFHKRLIQLTWRSGLGFEYDKETLRLKKYFHYAYEGWGITNDGRHLIMSDGSSRLYFLDPGTYEEVRRIDVHDPGRKVQKLNELEYINGCIYANVWLTGRIAVIDPSSGIVRWWIGLETLVQDAGGDNSVKTLNGIAYNPAEDTLLVTGKLWPFIYEIRLLESDKLPAG